MFLSLVHILFKIFNYIYAFKFTMGDIYQEDDLKSNLLFYSPSYCSLQYLCLLIMLNILGKQTCEHEFRKKYNFVTSKFTLCDNHLPFSKLRPK